MRKIDAHIHVDGNHADNIAFMDSMNLKFLNVCVSSPSRPWRSQSDIYRSRMEAHPDNFAWCASFDMPVEADYADQTVYADRAIKSLETDLGAGAIGCKIWKNVGMEFKKPSGEFLMIDDPIFDPIYVYLKEKNSTLLLHIGEPLACWQPLVDDNPHYGYYSNNPQWHMYDKPEFPHHTDLIAARDRMVAKHPDLRVVGAHLASLEYDVTEVAKRLDDYPNFAVDTSARTNDLTYQDPDVVRKFFSDYPDRILFGTDIVQRRAGTDQSDEDRARGIASAKERFELEFGYYESNGKMTMRKREVEALGLPSDVLEKFYYSNVRNWYPGV